MTEPVALNAQMIGVLAILGCTIFLFVIDIVRVDVVAILVLVVLGLTTLIPWISRSSSCRGNIYRILQ